MTTKDSTEEYKKPTIHRYSQFFAMSPAGCKLGYGVFPFKGLKDFEKAKTEITQVYLRTNEQY